MLKQKKYIKKVVVELETSSMEQALALKKQTASVFSYDFYALLEEILENILQKYGAHTRLKFSKIALEIDVENLQNIGQIEAEISTQINRQIDQKISKSVSSDSSEKRPKISTYKYDGYFHFLTYGTYPWWEEFDRENANLSQDTWLSDPDFIVNLKIELKKSNTLIRLIYNSDIEYLTNLLYKFLDESKLIYHDVLARNIEALNRKQQISIWHTLLRFSLNKDIEIIQRNLTKDASYFSDEKSRKIVEIIVRAIVKLTAVPNVISEEKTTQLLDDIFRAIRPNIDLNKVATLKGENFLASASEEKIDTTKKSSSEIYIEHAGLIILHPFLERLFKTLGFLDQKKLKKESWHAATHVLYYLATKTENPHEHELQFAKYLCNIPEHQPIDRYLTLGQAQKDECETVLQAALHHWDGLKTQNTDVLRSEFLMRDGKLTITNDLEKLYIQRKAQDILLDTMPWTIGVAKLPWKKELIYTEW